MLTFLGFVLGQILAIGFQWARWVDDTRGWGDYFRHRKQQARHVMDAIVSVVVWFAWGTGMLAQFGDLAPETVRGWIAKLPAANVEPLAAGVLGFALCFAVRFVQSKYFDKPEPPPTSGDTPINKGD